MQNRKRWLHCSPLKSRNKSDEYKSRNFSATISLYVILKRVWTIDTEKRQLVSYFLIVTNFFKFLALLNLNVKNCIINKGKPHLSGFPFANKVTLSLIRENFVERIKFLNHFIFLLKLLRTSVFGVHLSFRKYSLTFLQNESVPGLPLY